MNLYKFIYSPYSSIVLNYNIETYNLVIKDILVQLYPLSSTI